MSIQIGDIELALRNEVYTKAESDARYKTDKFSMVTMSNSISFTVKTATPQKVYVDFGDGTNGVYDCDDQGCSISHTMETTPASNEWTIVVESKELTYLYCSYNSLTSLDVTGLTALQTLECGANSLTSLDVTGLTALQTLYCGSNSLTSLDVTGLTALQTLECGSNSLTSLDVTGLTALQTLYCSYNSLTSLDVTGLTALQTLECGYNSLTSLDVTGLTALQTLYCGSNSLTVAVGNAILTSLVNRTSLTTGAVYIKTQTAGTIAVTVSIATAKNWTVA